MTTLAEFRGALLSAIRSVDQKKLADLLWPIGVEWDQRPQWADGARGCLFINSPRHEKHVTLPGYSEPFNGELLLNGFLIAQSSPEHPYCTEANDAANEFWQLAKADPRANRPTEYRDLFGAVSYIHRIRDQWTALLTAVAALPARPGPPRMPSDDAIKAFRLKLLGTEKQTEIAEIMTRELGRTVHQGSVSRWIEEVAEYLKNGGILPEIGAPARKAEPIDPAKLDLGARRDGRTRRQRQHAEHTFEDD